MALVVSTNVVLQCVYLDFIVILFLQAITKEFDSRYIDGTIDSGGQYRLDVDVNTLTFTHHDLMSREHVLASRLTLLANQYQERKKLNVVEFHSEKVFNLPFFHLQLNGI